MVLLGFSNIAKHIKLGADPILISAFANHARYIYDLNNFPIGEADKARSWTHRNERTQSSSRRYSVRFGDHELDKQMAS